MDIVKVFGTNVKKYRKATYISAIECFRRSIALENIQRIADALEIEPYKLFIDKAIKK